MNTAANTAMQPADDNEKTGGDQPGKRSTTPWSRRIIAGVLVVALVVTLGDGLGLIGLPAGGLTKLYMEYFWSGNNWHLLFPGWAR
ncbi:MAG: hypothetical protein AAFO98_09855 [Pseudomonadota bacterium]